MTVPGPTDVPVDERRLRRVLTAVVLTQLLVVIDFFALNLTLPPMAAEFGVPVTNLQWVVSGYMIAVGALMVPAGRIADVVGRKRIMVIGVAIFGGASFVCGVAPNETIVVAFRVVQGVGAAMCFPVSLAIITATFPAARVQRSLGLVYGLSAMGTALGPLVGGLLSELSWRWVLLMNVPLALVAIVLSLTAMEENRDEAASKHIDWAGVTLVVLGLAVFTYGVDKAGDWGWTAPGTLLLLFGGAALLVVLVVVEAHRANPILDLALFRNRAYVVITSAGAIANAVYVVTIFASSLYLQNVRNLTPARAGMVFLSLSVGAAVSGQAAGRLEKMLPQWVMAMALGVGGMSLLLLTASDNWLVYLVAFLGVGLGLGLGWAYATVGSQIVVPANEAGLASGLTLTILVSLGGVAIAGAATAIDQIAGTTFVTTEGPIDDVLRVVALVAIVGAVLTPVLGHLRADQVHRRPAE